MELSNPSPSIADGESDVDIEITSTDEEGENTSGDNESKSELNEKNIKHYVITNNGTLLINVGHDNCSPSSESSEDISTKVKAIVLQENDGISSTDEQGEQSPLTEVPPTRSKRKINEHFRQRKKCKKLSIKNEHGGNIFIYHELVIIANENATECFIKINRMANEVYPFRDNAKWRTFYQKVDVGLESSKQPGNEEIFLTIEKSIGLSYQDRLEEAENMAERAWEMIISNGPGLKTQKLFFALYFILKASLYRRKNNPKKAWEAASLARRYLESVEKSPHDNFTWALLLYEEANALFMQDGEETKAVQLYKECISRCQEMISLDPNMYVLREQFAKLKIAFIYLKSNTALARMEPEVKEHNVQRALCYINSVREGPKGKSLKMLLRSAESAYYVRTGNPDSATKSCREAIEKAKTIEFHIQTHDLQQRLKEIS